jgi:hypothetical protein
VSDHLSSHAFVRGTDFTGPAGTPHCAHPGCGRLYGDPAHRPVPDERPGPLPDSATRAGSQLGATAYGDLPWPGVRLLRLLAQQYEQLGDQQLTAADVAVALTLEADQQEILAARAEEAAPGMRSLVAAVIAEHTGFHTGEDAMACAGGGCQSVEWEPGHVADMLTRAGLLGTGPGAGAVLAAALGQEVEGLRAAHEQAVLALRAAERDKERGWDEARRWQVEAEGLRAELT